MQYELSDLVHWPFLEYLGSCLLLMRFLERFKCESNVDQSIDEHSGAIVLLHLGLQVNLTRTVLIEGSVGGHGGGDNTQLIHLTLLAQGVRLEVSARKGTRLSLPRVVPACL